MKTISTDVLVIGGGLAGLCAAYTARTIGAQVMLISCGAKASPHVIGYSCPVEDGDDPEAFAADMIRAGEGLNNRQLVEAFVHGAKELPGWLEALGQTFDRQDGKYALMRSLGHSSSRLVHHAVATGAETLGLLEKLAPAAGVCVREGTRCLSIVTEGGAAAGAVLLDTLKTEMFHVRCGSIVLAAGGCHLTLRSTYPADQSGDGYALAYQAGAGLLDMEFVQHEPLRSAVMPVGLSTTMLIKGGKLINNEGCRFVLNTFESEAIPTKDRLSQLIADEIQQGRGTKNGGVFADMTALSPEAFSQHQAIYERFLKRGVDLKKEPVEVAPAAHTMMGGIEINDTCATNVKGLFAAGEAAGGLHGASRLGGNAGTEAVVFGRIAGKSAAECAGKAEYGSETAGAEFEKWLSALLKKPCTVPDPGILRRYTLDTMEKALGPVRNGADMALAMDRLETYASALRQTGLHSIAKLDDYYSAANLVLVCRLVCLGALNRRETRGAHGRSDYPAPSEKAVHIRFQKNAGMKITEE